MNVNRISIFISTLVWFLILNIIDAQRTSLDATFGKFYRNFRLFGLSVVGDTNRNIGNLRRAGKTLQIVPKDLKFNCDTKNGPGKRSDTPPTSVHRLRPGDIDIIGAIGDSLTAGNGIYATRLTEILVENRGTVWSIGGEGNWRQKLTLPNILKEFNPNLYGYSVGNGLATDYSSKFNVAELGAMSIDTPYEAEILTKRLKHDPMVNMTHHWKLVTIFIGNNDFCSDMCFYSNPKNVLRYHERHMLKTLRFLRDNVPRLFVNVVPAPNLRLLTRLTGLPQQCQKTLIFECPCLIGKSKKTLDYYEKIMKAWAALDSQIVHRAEFNTETFTVNYQPFTQFNDFPKLPNGNTDLRFLSADCFHLSQRGQASAANSIWNNMLEPDDSKTTAWTEAFDVFKCPTSEKPFLATRSN